MIEVGKLAIVEPTAMPATLNPDLGVGDQSIEVVQVKMVSAPAAEPAPDADDED